MAADALSIFGLSQTRVPELPRGRFMWDDYQDQLVGERGSLLMINTGSERPIGYWLKKLDSLIDRQFERHIGEAGISRRQWQLLNLVEDGPRSVPDLQVELEPFLQAQFGLVKAKVAELRQGLIAGISPEEYEATIEVLARMAANLESD
jgi:hypothetical protein